MSRVMIAGEEMELPATVTFPDGTQGELVCYEDFKTIWRNTPRGPYQLHEVMFVTDRRRRVVLAGNDTIN